MASYRDQESNLLFRDIVLGVHEARTPADLEAEQIVKELLEEVDPSLKDSLDIRTDLEIEGCRKPFMLASPYRIHSGLEAIRSFVHRHKQERLHDTTVAS